MGIDFLVNEIIKSTDSPKNKSILKTNYSWNFFDFSEAVQLSIFKHLIENLTDVDLEDYYEALEDAKIFMDSLRIHKMSDVLVKEFEKVFKEFDRLLYWDTENLINDR